MIKLSRVSNAINMFLLLQVRKMMSVKELAKELEVSERMIKTYKNDLEMAGIYVESRLGRNGGYYLSKKGLINNVDLTAEEISALRMANEVISVGKYPYSKELKILTSKILGAKEHFDTTSYYTKSITEIDEIVNLEKRILVDLNLAINKKQIIKMEYKSLKPQGIEVRERMVNPYGIFDYNGSSYFYGYCEERKEIRFFKLSRIIKYKVLEEKFESKVKFNFKEVMEKSFGIYNDKEIQVKIKIKYPMSEIVKEKQISKQQRITQIDEKTIYFEAKMSGYTEIKSWVMSMGGNVEIIYPKRLKDDIHEEAKKILKI